MKDGPYLVSRLMPSAAVQFRDGCKFVLGSENYGINARGFPSSFSNLNRDRSLRNGQVFTNATPAWQGLASLALWALVSYWVAWFALRGKERG